MTEQNATQTPTDPAFGETVRLTAADTLPQWLHQRFGAYLHGGNNQPWEQMEDADRDYWAHEAAAVRRAVERGGFKVPEGAGQ